MTDAEARELIETSLGDTLIVEAAAGTGKTTALVRRIVRMLAEGCATVDQIVAVTFTEKAAGELKLRLRERLDRVRGEAASGSEVRARLDAALSSLEEAHVSTIHGFCADLLRERPVEAGVDPLFDVLTEPAAERMFGDAFDRWLQEQLADPPEGVRRALSRTSYGGDEGPVDRLRTAAWDLAGWRDFRAPWTRNPFDRAAQVAALVEALHDCAELTRDPSSRTDPLFVGTEPIRRLSDEIQVTQTFGDTIGEADEDAWEASLVDLSRDRVLANAKHGRGTWYRDGVRRDRVLQAVEALRVRLDQFRVEADADLAALLQRDLRGAIDRYETMKSRAGALDFLDLLLLARNLVRDNPDVRRSFQQRFTRLFVDEFQDTDPLQAELLMLLASEDPEETAWRRVTPVRGRLFLVGDPKQSIYRFRRADVAIYRDVCEQLQRAGAKILHLQTSFRSVPEIQSLVNAAFAGVMTGDDRTLQAAYVPLERHRPAIEGQPAIVALPVPSPYAVRYITARAIDASLPQAVGAFIDWAISSSGWRVTERTGSAPVPVAAKHICVLFRRFVSWGSDVTRPYVDALEARGIPHVLVGGRAFHEREEVEALRAALAAIEWPDDELSIFATLRGPLFAIGDEELLEYAHAFGRQIGGAFRRHVFHPHRIPDAFEADSKVPAGAQLERLRPIADALQLLKRLHARRNYVPVSATLHELLGATRAHVGFALRPGGEQALANVLHIAELAREYEATGGISFRGFVEELRDAADAAQAAEAPILEEDSDGVRIMTVHKAKGLEFPVVVLADLSCKLSRPDAGRWIDPSGELCALKLGGWAPADLLLHGADEAARDQAEGQRLAYVAATRARDILVVPAVGDEVQEGGWLGPLMDSVYPAAADRRDPSPSPGCPAFRSKDSVMNRPNGDPAGPATVAPGTYRFTNSPTHQPTDYSVTWWDPHILALDAPSTFGLRRDDLINKDGDPDGIAARLHAYETWSSERAEAIARASVQSVRARTVTDIVSGNRDLTPDGGSHPPDAKAIAVVDLPRAEARPYGPQFGTLVHAILATAPLDATEALLARIGSTQGRILLAPEEEIYAAVEVAAAALRHPLFERVRTAAGTGACERELPIIWRAADGTLVEGTIDLAFEEGDGTVVLDFKTDRELRSDLMRYRRQVALYCEALQAMRGRAVRGVIMRI